MNEGFFFFLFMTSLTFLLLVKLKPSDVENRLTRIETVLIMKKVMPQEICTTQENKIEGEK